MGPRRIKRTKTDMFGNPAQEPAPAPVPALAPVRPPVRPKPVRPAGARDRTADRAKQDLQRAASGWGNQANFSLAAPPGKFQSLLVDLWTQWWRPWAPVGILLAIVLVAVLLKVI